LDIYNTEHFYYFRDYTLLIGIVFKYDSYILISFIPEKILSICFSASSIKSLSSKSLLTPIVAPTMVANGVIIQFNAHPKIGILEIIFPTTKPIINPMVALGKCLERPIMISIILLPILMILSLTSIVKFKTVSKNDFISGVVLSSSISLNNFACFVVAVFRSIRD